MKHGFIGGKRPERFDDAVRLARECGYEGLEFDYWREFETLITDDAVARMASGLKAGGVRLSGYGLWGYNYLSPVAEERAHALKMLDRAIGYAERLGAYTMILSTGDLPNEPPGRKVAEFMRVFPPILDRIASAGMKASFYALHGATFLNNIEAFERLWEHRSDVLMKFDPANWACAGFDYVDILRRYGNKVGHIHIKEMIRDAQGRIVSQPPAGWGEIQWGKVFTFLHEHRYEGYLSLEPHKEPWLSGDGLRKNLVLSKRYIDQFLL